jgi:hypothetical protein
MAVTHFGARLDPYDFLIFYGHTPSLDLRDLDGDGRPELAVLYHCGAHSRGLRLFRFDHEEMFVPVPGGEVCSDVAGIKLEDADADGKVEVYSWNRSYNRGPIADTVTRYVFREGSLHEDTTLDNPSGEIRIPPSHRRLTYNNAMEPTS